jgi:hypothetical protein
MKRRERTLAKAAGRCYESCVGRADLIRFAALDL